MCLLTEGYSTICYDRLTCRFYPFDRIETSFILNSWEWWKGELNSGYASCSFLGLGRLPMDSRAWIVVDMVWDYYVHKDDCEHRRLYEMSRDIGKIC